MSSDKRQLPGENDPKAGLSPVAIGVALGAAAAVWLIVEIIQRAL